MTRLRQNLKLNIGLNFIFYYLLVLLSILLCQKPAAADEATSLYTFLEKSGQLYDMQDTRGRNLKVVLDVRADSELSKSLISYLSSLRKLQADTNELTQSTQNELKLAIQGNLANPAILYGLGYGEGPIQDIRSEARTVEAFAALASFQSYLVALSSAKWSKLVLKEHYSDTPYLLFSKKALEGGSSLVAGNILAATNPSAESKGYLCLLTELSFNGLSLNGCSKSDVAIFSGSAVKEIQKTLFKKKQEYDELVHLELGSTYASIEQLTCRELPPSLASTPLCNDILSAVAAVCSIRTINGASQVDGLFVCSKDEIISIRDIILSAHNFFVRAKP